MKHCNELFIILISVFTVCSMQGMKPKKGLRLTEEKIEIDFPIQIQNLFTIINECLEKKEGSIETLKNFIWQDMGNTLRSMIPSARTIAYSQNPSISDLQRLKQPLYELYLDDYPQQTCPELKILLQSYEQDQRNGSFYKENINLFIPFLKKQKPEKMPIIQKLSQQVSNPITTYQDLEQLITDICPIQKVKPSQLSEAVARIALLQRQKQEEKKEEKEQIVQATAAAPPIIPAQANVTKPSAQPIQVEIPILPATQPATPTIPSQPSIQTVEAGQPAPTPEKEQIPEVQVPAKQSVPETRPTLIKRAFSGVTSSIAYMWHGITNLVTGILSYIGSWLSPTK